MKIEHQKIEHLKIEHLNKEELDRWNKENPDEEPTITDLVFELRLIPSNSDLKSIQNFSIGEVQGYFLSKAIGFLEKTELWDDYDDFKTEVKLQPEDLQDNYNYLVTIAVTKQN